MAQLLSSVYSWVSANPYLAGVGASAAYILLRKLLARDAFQIRNVAPIIKNPKKDVVYLFEFAPLDGKSNGSPFCLKLETYLRLAGIEFEVVVGQHTGVAPRGKVPFIQFNDQVISDSSVIIHALKQKLGDKFDATLSADQLALTVAVRSLVEDHLAPIITNFRWVQPGGWAQWKQAVFGRLGFPLSAFVPNMVQSKVKKAQWIAGPGRFTEAELLEFARKDFAALTHFLGDKKFILGDEFHEVDASVYGAIAQLFNIPLDTPLHKLAKEQTTLYAYYQRVTERLDALPKMTKYQKN